MQRSKHLFSYRTSHNFLCIATKWNFGRNETALGAEGVCMVFLSGVGSTSDLWSPVVERLNELQTQKNRGPFVESIWAIDRPSHGDSGVLNEPTLAESPSKEYAAAFEAFMTSPLLSSKERANLILVAHSAGISAPVYAPSAWKMEHRFQSLVLIEPTIFDNCSAGIFDQWIRRVEKVLEDRGTTWTTLDDVMASNRSWRKYHPKVRAIIANTFFRPTGSLAEITTKTAVSQETSALKEVALSLDIAQRLSVIIPKIPTHIIYGSRRDYWSNFFCIRSISPTHASVTQVMGAGHFTPQEAPNQVADSIYRAVVATAVFDGSRLFARL
ncbi:Alpha/beta hydrolase fold-1 [Mycena galericulata]|nr:Alpha/beta hydrolase fold-1 [Mycena galericulata]